MKRLVICWAASLLVMTAVAQEAEDQPDVQEEEAFVIPQVAVSAFLVKMSPSLAADWGLDGGPAAKPQETPLKGDIPKCMTKEQARTLITALRKHKETEILGSMSLVVQSGQEVFGSSVKEMMIPESFDEPDIYFEDPEAAKDGELVKKSVRQIKPKTPPAKFDLSGLTPIFGTPRTDVGFILTLTPQVGEDDKTINLSLHPKMTIDRLVDSLLPLFVTIELRTDIVLKDGQTMIIMNGTPALNGDYYKYKPDAATDRRPFIMFLTAEIVKLPKTEK